MSCCWLCAAQQANQARKAAVSLPLWWPFLSHGFVGVGAGVGAFAPLAGRRGTVGVLAVDPICFDVLVGCVVECVVGVDVGFVMCGGDGFDTGTRTATGGTVLVRSGLAVECDEVFEVVVRVVATEGVAGMAKGVTDGVADVLAGGLDKGVVVDGVGVGDKLLRGTMTTGVPPGFGVTMNCEFAPVV